METPPIEQPQNQEAGPQYIRNFDELFALGSTDFGEGTEVTFQPHGRYFDERQTGTVRVWDNEPDIISINFMGDKCGVKQPDNERITRGTFGERVDTLKIQKAV